MEDCAKNKLYQEALDLKTFVDDFHLRHPNITIISNLIQEMNNISEYMLNDLLKTLETNIGVNECIKIIGYLRRMNAFEDELLLRKEFLSKLNTNNNIEISDTIIQLY